MSEPHAASEPAESGRDTGRRRRPRVVVVGPDGMAVEARARRRRRRRALGHRAGRPAGQGDADRQHDQAAARGGARTPSLDEASRVRLKEIHTRSIKELEEGLAPELVEELERISLPFTDDAIPSESELRIAQAQLVGWLEGLFHGIQTALFAQQMAARAQFEEMRRRALPAGVVPAIPGGPGPGAEPGERPERPHQNTGQYL